MKEHETFTEKNRYFPYPVPIRGDAWTALSLEKGRRSLVNIPEAPFPLFSRYVAYSYNKKWEGETGAVSAGELTIFGTILKVYRYILGLNEGKGDDILIHALTKRGHGADSPPGKMLFEKFVELFPGTSLISREESADTYLRKEGVKDEREKMVSRELFLLRIANMNEGTLPFRKLHDEECMAVASPYTTALVEMFLELEKGPPLYPFDQNVVDLFLGPIKASPRSLRGQIEYIRKHWAFALPEELIGTIDMAIDLLKEEERERHGGAGSAPVLTFDGEAVGDDGYPEYEGFTSDTDWMPNIVLLAKMAYVWLSQLSRYYGKQLTRLDEIPDEELEKISRWGFNSLWLIGIWERSPASKKIKHIKGNIDAAASAYSLYDYTVAEELGGYEALRNLKERAWRKGIRLACDMVPNHTGIYSKWIREHPDWFIQQSYPPYPSYRFTGENLSFCGDFSLRIEDGYWENGDAAVVFEHLEYKTGRVRYIYHGNDGTSTPWNDTAQINYLIPEVREEVIRTIVNIARTFPIIRFDAAMTLAKKHFQRLWFPPPGEGESIPSRSLQGMSRKTFDLLFPTEFWRELVDRIALEAPDTLLIAEAFWLMEGYFVRTLGMHRVYNSAFMNMLKREENANFRQTLKNILAFDPRILQRFVNFMNNPDEDTAVSQFGKGDKYFGVAVMLVTMPGLPMFGHGQVEGLGEKYGMEYWHAYLDEEPDSGFIAAHETMIFPLLKKRWLFSGASNFVLYDFFSGDRVNEDVFAYSNMAGGEKALVIYNNRFSEAKGWIRTSTGMIGRDEEGKISFMEKTLAGGLHIRGDDSLFTTFRDHGTGLEYIRRGREISERGLYLELGAYQWSVFLHFMEIKEDQEGMWGTLCDSLAGRGVTSLREEMRRVKYGNIHSAFKELVSETFEEMAECILSSGHTTREEVNGLFPELLKKYTDEVERRREEGREREIMEREVYQGIWKTFRFLQKVKNRSSFPFHTYLSGRGEVPALCAAGVAYSSLDPMAGVFKEKPVGKETSPFMEEFAFDRAVEDLFHSLRKEGRISSFSAYSLPKLLALVLSRPHFIFTLQESGWDSSFLEELFEDLPFRNYLELNLYGGITWFSKERFEEVLFWCTFAAFSHIPESREEKWLALCEEYIFHLLDGAERAGYRLDRFFNEIKFH